MLFRELTLEQTLDHKQRIQDAAEGIHFGDSDVKQDRFDAIHFGLDSEERRLASPDLSLDGYEAGVANFPDATYVHGTGSRLLITSEHATTHYRTNAATSNRVMEYPETGTAALASLLGFTCHGKHLTLLGQQTGDANYDPQHPFKEELKGLITEDKTEAVVTMHGMLSGHVESLDDTRSYDLVVGIGDQPSDQTLLLGTRILNLAESHGLKAGLNQPLLKFKEEGGKYLVRVDEDGEFKPTVLAASLPRTTRSTAEEHARQEGLETACVQIELADTLRLVDTEIERSERVELLGPYIGFNFLYDVLEMYK